MKRKQSKLVRSLAMFLILLLSGCGFQVTSDLKVNSQALSVNDSILTGALVATVTTIGITTCSYKLKKNFNLFAINPAGEISVTIDNPPHGIYQLSVLLNCTDGSAISETIVIAIDEIGVQIPTLPWLKQIGSTSTGVLGVDGSMYDGCYRSAVGADGSLYCAGRTQSSLGETNGGGYDAVIVKLNPSGEVAWIRQLGSATALALGINVSGDDRCLGVAVDTSGNVYCGGGTRSSMTEANAGSEDIFITKLDSSGNLLWVKQLGATTVSGYGGSATGTDRCFNVITDNLGNVYCSGGTQSALNDVFAGGEVFVIEANPNPNIAKEDEFASSAKHLKVKYPRMIQKVLDLGLKWSSVSK